MCITRRRDNFGTTRMLAPTEKRLPSPAYPNTVRKNTHTNKQTNRLTHTCVPTHYIQTGRCHPGACACQRGIGYGRGGGQSGNDGRSKRDCVHTHTHIRTHPHPPTHTQIHPRKQTRAHTSKHALTQINAHTQINVHAHTHTHTHTGWTQPPRSLCVSTSDWLRSRRRPIGKSSRVKARARSCSAQRQRHGYGMS